MCLRAFVLLCVFDKFHLILRLLDIFFSPYLF